MAQGTAFAPVVPYLLPSKVYSTGLQRGAAVIADATNKGVKAPTAAKDAGFAGFIYEHQASTGTASGDPVSLQTAGVAIGLLKAGASITYGQELMIGDADGSLIVADFTNGSSVVGISLATFTAGTYADPFPVLVLPYTVRK